MNVYRDQMSSSCYFHPKEIVVGVCALCLNDRLLVLASTRGGRYHSSARSCRNKPHINLSKIFSFTSFISRLEFRHWKPENSDDDDDVDDASTSHEESFISIDFGKNGGGSWERSKVSEFSHKKQKQSKETRTRGWLRWRKRIGQVFHVMRRKWSNKGTVVWHVEGVKTRKGGSSWIRSLTKSTNSG